VAIFIEPSMRCPDRLACAVYPTAAARVCMICVIIPATGLFRQLSPEGIFSGECRTRRHIPSALTGFDHVALNLMNQPSAHAGVVDGFRGSPEACPEVTALHGRAEFFPLRGPFAGPRRQCLSFNSSR
jgi:hypothetical protein